MKLTGRARRCIASLALFCPLLVGAHDPAQGAAPPPVVRCIEPHLVAGLSVRQSIDVPPPAERRVDLAAGPWNIHVESELMSASYRTRRFEVGAILDSLFSARQSERDFDDPPHPGQPVVEPAPVEGGAFVPGDANVRVFATLFF
jgi:hypothetical protein